MLIYRPEKTRRRVTIEFLRALISELTVTESTSQFFLLPGEKENNGKIVTRKGREAEYVE